MITIPKMIYDDFITNDKSFFGLFLMQLFRIKSHVRTFPRTPNNWMLTQDMFIHRSNLMLLVSKNHTFFPFGGTTNILILVNKMANQCIV
jgi:hypothetical protein